MNKMNCHISLLFLSLFMGGCSEQETVLPDNENVVGNNNDDNSDTDNSDEEDSTIDTDQGKYNVLLVYVDDLRKELGIYGRNHIYSPNIDKLANKGVFFDNAYCQVAVSGPSRASMLSGIRPSGTRFVQYNCRLDQDAPNAISMPQFFKNNGYTTVSYGKVFHNQQDSEDSWDELWRINSSNKDNYAIPSNQLTQPPTESADVEDNQYIDGKTVDKAIAKLEQFALDKTPFFMSVGFVKPHLPFCAPKKYWDLYTNVGLPDNYNYPQNCPDKIKNYTWNELRNYYGIPESGPVTNEQAIELRRGYYACISFVDSLIGRLMNTLEESGLDENTIVILLGDHGWNLGEHNLWCKHNTFKNVVNAPLIIRIPNTSVVGKCNALVEFVDIFPTLCDFCGLKNLEQFDGISLRPVLENVNNSFKEAVYSRYSLMECVKTVQYQYTEFYNGFQAVKILENMLYDHNIDENENNNIAENPELSDVVKELSELLKNNRSNLE